MTSSHFNYSSVPVRSSPMSIVPQRSDHDLYGPDNNLPQDLIQLFQQQPNLTRVTTDTSTAAHAVIKIEGKTYTSFVRARNKDRLQLAYWWNPVTREGV